MNENLPSLSSIYPLSPLNPHLPAFGIPFLKADYNLSSPQNWRATPRRFPPLGNAREGIRGAKFAVTVSVTKNVPRVKDDPETVLMVIRNHTEINSTISTSYQSKAHLRRY